MATVIEKFSNAVKILSSPNTPMRENIGVAYFNYLKDIETRELPEELQLIYDSVRLRVVAVFPHGNINDDEAGYIAADIRYLADALNSRNNCRLI